MKIILPDGNIKEMPQGSSAMDLAKAISPKLAQAVQMLFPSAKIASGPAIESGFYYDFDVEKPFTPDDLVAIEAKA
ncbi:MAG TPA: TGS domain-containing protein, partial [Chitinispirillaceae bacterium]|nr:TGS domain-containing protein [Chitinispirillaceae bacterium]